MQKRWYIKQRPSPEIITNLQTDLKVSELMATLLAQRSLTTTEAIRSYFKPNLSELHDPLLMLGMEKAVACLEKHVANKQKIMVYGDYDVDGTTAVALVYQLLSSYTEVEFYIPDRHNEGYGISFAGVDFAIQQECSLMIALDCGIREVEKIAYAKEKGLEVIVCDHHNPGDVIPECIVLDPKQPNCPYPFKELCGCGVGFKLLQAWLTHRGEELIKLHQQLDLVAIAIGADIVPITDENRVLCSLGIAHLNQHKRAGIEALIQSAAKSYPLKLSDLVFTIAPRINAAGRLNSGAKAVQLLLAKTLEDAQAIATEINTYNTERRSLDAITTQEALEIIGNDTNYENSKSTVVYHPDWNKGVVGIVASRLIEKNYRPTIVLTESNGVATGSARSVADFNIYEAIRSCEDLLIQFGGHHHAAGLSLQLENIEQFKTAFDSYVQQNIKPIDTYEELIIDLEIKLNELFIAGESSLEVPRVYKLLDQLEPFGPGNDKPVFCIRNVFAENQKILKENHLRFQLFDPKSNIRLQAIGFNMADKLDLVAAGCTFDCAFTLETNTWNNQTTLQLQVRDIQEKVHSMD